MRSSLSNSRFVGLFISFSCTFIVGTLASNLTTLEIASNSSVTAGPYPKLHDIVGCASEYGENLDRRACYKALQTMPDGAQFLQFVSRKSYPGQQALITPVYYYDNQSKSLNRVDLDRGRAKRFCRDL